MVPAKNLNCFLKRLRFVPAWQLCYDETTGYPYYWNTATNAVTWEPPPEVVAMQSAMAAETANSDWAVEEAALGLPPRSHTNLVPKPAGNFCFRYRYNLKSSALKRVNSSSQQTISVCT